MKRPEQHVIADQSELLLRSLLPAEWIIRSITKDYGVDLEIELVDQELVSGNRIWVQLKGVKQCETRTAKFPVQEQFREELGLDELSITYVPFSLDSRELQYSLKCAFPLLLLVADLNQGDVYWLPIRDEVLGSLSQRNPTWTSQQSATLHIPSWNRLSWERESGYPGLRWYAHEPARMYAFAIVHYYHHEFQITGRLSGYEIGDGWIDHGEELELRTSLELAHQYVSAALNIDVLFGVEGIDFFKAPLPLELGRSLASQLEQAVAAARAALDALERQDYSFGEMATLLGRVSHGIELLSTAISAYQGFRQKFLLTEATALWRAAKDIHGIDGPPTYPIHRQGYKG